MDYVLRKAHQTDAVAFWMSVAEAIKRRKADGSDQWQDGYPNPAVIQADIDKRNGYVLTDKDRVVGYCAILINDEPEYLNIKGKWLTQGDFVVYHRVAISEDY